MDEVCLVRLALFWQALFYLYIEEQWTSDNLFSWPEIVYSRFKLTLYVAKLIFWNSKASKVLIQNNQICFITHKVWLDRLYVSWHMYVTMFFTAAKALDFPIFHERKAQFFNIWLSNRAQFSVSKSIKTMFIVGLHQLLKPEITKSDFNITHWKFEPGLRWNLTHNYVSTEFI